MKPSPFNKTTQKRLVTVLAAPERADESMSYPELAGFLFGVCCCPEMIPPSEWLPLVLGEGDPGYRDEIQAQQTLGDLMALYNAVNDGVFTGAPTLPLGCDWREPVTQNFEDDAPMCQWARGFAGAYDWLVEVWDDAVVAEWENDMGAAMMTLSFFASRELAVAYQQETQVIEGTLEDAALAMREVFPEALEAFAGMGRSMADFTAAPPQPASSSKVGRNESCPCGSGKKYKKCCGVQH